MYKRSISNLAWSKEHDTEMYQFLTDNNFEGIEIAPSRIFGETPYAKIEDAKHYKNELLNIYNLEISSMQSIWFGKTENIFNSKSERDNLFEYTKRAIEFANILDCKNLVFGCPKNRKVPDRMDKMDCYNIALEFFSIIGEYALKNNTCFSIEANPEIYGTNFINNTDEAITIIKNIASQGIKLNLDTGTMIYNKESINLVKENLLLINHIHISEPYLKYISFNELQDGIINFINCNTKYTNYISIETSICEDISLVKKIVNKLTKHKEQKTE